MVSKRKPGCSEGTEEVQGVRWVVSARSRVKSEGPLQILIGAPLSLSMFYSVPCWEGMGLLLTVACVSPSGCQTKAQLLRAVINRAEDERKLRQSKGNMRKGKVVKVGLFWMAAGQGTKGRQVEGESCREGFHGRIG